MCSTSVSYEPSVKINSVFGRYYHLICFAQWKEWSKDSLRMGLDISFVIISLICMYSAGLEYFGYGCNDEVPTRLFLLSCFGSPRVLH